MVVRLGRGLWLAGWLLFAGVGPGLAQGALTGELEAPDVAGYVVIACFADVDVGCDEARSGYAAIEGGGSRAAWRIDGLERGPFLVLGWLDANGDGEGQEDELLVLNDEAGEPRLVTAPDDGLVLRAARPAAAPTRRSVHAAGAAEPAAPSGRRPRPADWVGVWQEIRASGGDYRDLTTGNAFSMTSGFSTMLKLRADGSFLFQFYSSGVAPDCALVTNLDTAVGWATVEGSNLVLRPTERSVEIGHCANSGTYASDLEPLVLPAQLTESFDFEGHRAWKLTLEGGPVPLDLDLLFRPPSATPPQPAQADDFVVGTDPPYSDIQGVWSTHPNSDLGFFDPATNAWYLPEYNGARHLWLRFTGNGYDLARAWSNYGFGGICEKDYVYYEHGRADLATLEDIGGLGDQFRGHARFEADDARVVVQIRDCGSDDGATLYTLTPQVSYYEWRYRMATNDIVSIPEGFSLSCPWSRSEWQFMVCDGNPYGPSFGRR